MKKCTNCYAEIDDNAAFCPYCGFGGSTASKGSEFGTAQNQYGNSNQYGGYSQYQPQVPAYDHTPEFNPNDISDNKPLAMCVYLLGIFGIIIALLGSRESPYVRFHVRQSIKFLVVEVLSSVVCALLCWTVIVPVAYGIFMLVLLVIKIICFFNVCSGKAIEPAIVRSFGFLK